MGGMGGVVVLAVVAGVLGYLLSCFRIFSSKVLRPLKRQDLSTLPPPTDTDAAIKALRAMPSLPGLRVKWMSDVYQERELGSTSAWTRHGYKGPSAALLAHRLVAGLRDTGFRFGLLVRPTIDADTTMVDLVRDVEDHSLYGASVRFSREGAILTVEIFRLFVCPYELDDAQFESGRERAGTAANVMTSAITQTMQAHCREAFPV